MTELLASAVIDQAIASVSGAAVIVLLALAQFILARSRDNSSPRDKNEPSEEDKHRGHHD